MPRITICPEINYSYVFESSLEPTHNTQKEYHESYSLYYERQKEQEWMQCIDDATGQKQKQNLENYSKKDLLNIIDIISGWICLLTS